MGGMSGKDFRDGVGAGGGGVAAHRASVRGQGEEVS